MSGYPEVLADQPVGAHPVPFLQKPFIMGVVRIYHARPEAMPDHGAHHGLGLQLVGDLHALGNPGQACGSGDLASVGVVRHSSADPARQTTVEITSMHSKAGLIAAALTK